MKALVYQQPGKVALEERPKPTVSAPTDAVVKLKHTTICGTDLHIIKGDVPTAKPGTILGHEGVGVIESLGESVQGLKAGDSVLISCITACAACSFCRKGMHSHCVSGGWVLGNTVDGTQAEYVRIPHATASLYRLPDNSNLRHAVLLSDSLPTGLECGIINGRVEPGHLVAIIGSGPVGLSAAITAQLYSPSMVVAVDVDDERLATARKFAVTHTLNSKQPDAVQKLMALTDGQGYDTVVEAVGIPQTFDLCQQILAPGGVLANVGVHGTKVDLHLEKLWDSNISECRFLNP
jgi:alcohol dehydrogenase